MNEKFSMKALSVFLAGIMVSAAFAMVFKSGGAESRSETMAEILSSYGEKEAVIGSYYAPCGTEQQIRMLAGSGINEVVLDAWTSYSVRDEDGGYVYGDTGEVKESSAINSPQLAYTLELCAKYGVDVIIPFNNSTSTTPENIFTLDGVTEDYSKYEAFRGFDFFDEPGLSDFDAIASQIDEFYERYPGKLFFVNLLHMNASSTAETEDYDEYLRLYNEKIFSKLDADNKVLCFDMYPMVYDRNTQTTYIRENYALNLYKLAKFAKQTQAEFQGYIQTLGYATDHRYCTEDDIRFQVYAHLAFGAHGFKYFTYLTPPADGYFNADDYAMLGKLFYRTEVYDYVSAVNKEIKNFDNVLLDFEWQETVVSKAAQGTQLNGMEGALEKYASLQSATSTEDLVVGCFQDADGRDGFLAVNYTDPVQGKKNIVTLHFDGAEKAVVFIGGEPQEVALQNGDYTFRLDEGEGRFIIPFH